MLLAFELHNPNYIQSTSFCISVAYKISQPFFQFPDQEFISVTWDHPTLGPIPFGATPNDPAAHGREIYAAALAGHYGAVVSYAKSHWYSTADDNHWRGMVHKAGSLMISPTGEQPPNSTATA